MTPAKSEANCRSATHSTGPKTSASKAKDDAEAEKWYRKAAKQGYAPAQNNLGEMRRQGRGVTK